MKFIVTNDDGYKAVGLIKIVEFLKTIGEVIIIAPMRGQSCKSHAISIRKKFKVKHMEYLGCDAYILDSTPADCVRYATYKLHLDTDYIVISGINNGYNMGDDILYSGTVSASIEAGCRGYRSIALSARHDRNILAFSTELARVLEIIKKEELFKKWNVWNINIPEKFEGYKYTTQGIVYFDTTFKGNKWAYQSGVSHHEYEKRSETDVYVTEHKTLSIMPVTYDRTKYF